MCFIYKRSKCGDTSNLQVGNLPFASKALSTHGYGGCLVTYTAWNTTDPKFGIVLGSSDDLRLYTGALQPALSNQLSNQTYIVLHGHTQQRHKERQKWQ